ncbi:MAG TPA: hypothetical protein VF519_08710 [Mycobacteriales bacterium]|jgi:hypothetical protein
MGDHARGFAAFLTTSVGGFVVSALLYLLFHEPCRNVLGLRTGECVFGMSLGEFAQRTGILSLVVGVVIGFALDSS